MEKIKITANFRCKKNEREKRKEKRPRAVEGLCSIQTKYDAYCTSDALNLYRPLETIPIPSANPANKNVPSSILFTGRLKKIPELLENLEF